MNLLLAIAVLAFSLLCWGGQVISWVAPARAAKWGLTESASEVEPLYWADVRGEAAWDSLTLWTMPAAPVLAIADSSAWAYFGLLGGGMYLYFAGRGIVTRVGMRRRGFRIGSPASIRVSYTFLTAWGLMAMLVVLLAVSDLA